MSGRKSGAPTRTRAGPASTRERAPHDLVRPEGVPEDAILRLLHVPAEAAGMRVDVFVQSRLRRTSRTRARAIVERSAYTHDGRRLAASDRVREGQTIALWRDPFEPDGELAPLPVLYEDEHLLVIDKPPFVAVHPTARYHKHTVIKRLEAERPGEFLALIHRLDRETSGVLMLARTPEAEREFKLLLERRSLAPDAPESACEKEYLALVRGEPPDGLIDLPLEPDPESELRVKMRVAAPGTGLPARTEVQVLERRAGYALVRCGLHTGRQHQIRVHLAALGHPLVGDKLYGPDERLLARAADGRLTPEDLAVLELSRHALHAHCYRLVHAMTGRPLVLVSPLPPDLDQFWQGLSEPPGSD
ncbi:MAG: RluA family pseudouridine synthase [Pseudomonadota bacterium]